MAEIDLEQTIEDDVQTSLDENNEFNDPEEIQETASFLKISELKLKCRARNLRLKEEDVIVAVDGEPFHGSILELSNILSEEDKKLYLQLKEKKFFEVITFGSLGCTFKFTNSDETIEIEKLFKKHIIHPIEDYTIYEDFKRPKKKSRYY